MEFDGHPARGRASHEGMTEALLTAAPVTPKKNGRAKGLAPFFFALLLVIPLGLVCLGIGRMNISPVRVIGILASGAGIVEPSADWPEFESAVILNVRLPRIIMALCIGAGLAIAGAAFQGLFANPLATPDTLGVGAGASFGAALGILLSNNALVVQLVSLAAGLLAMGITYAISKIKERRSILMVILSGTITGAFFQALISLVKYVADPETKLPAITYWLMGSIADVSIGKILTALPLLSVGITILILMRWRLNVLSLNDDEATTLGVNVQRARWLVILASTMITASCVSLCGQIGWVGLVVPHIARMTSGSDHRRVVPLAAVLGACYLLVVDTAARTATPAEIPLSILTAMIGAPFFAVLLRKSGGGAWS